VVDNLRPSLGAYGEANVLSPHIDSLLKGSENSSGATLFSRAYCQEAWCSPSRNSFLTGRRPDTTQAWGFVSSFRDAPTGETWVTLPGHFKQQGYFAASSGKVFHPNLPLNFDYPRSWSTQPTFAEKDDCATVGRAPSNTSNTMSCAFAPGDGMTDADSVCTDQVLLSLDAWQSNYSRSGKPFFLAAGYQSPRLAWSYPQAVAARYPPAQQIPIASEALRKSPGASLALEWFRPTEIDWYSDVNALHAQPVPAAMQHELRRAYYAAITHVDDQVGRLLNVLQTKGLYESTLVVFTAGEFEGAAVSTFYAWGGVGDGSLLRDLAGAGMPVTCVVMLPLAPSPVGASDCCHCLV
jgi:iduronate 2-sulfatase